MTNINFEEMFNNIEDGLADNQKKVFIDSSLKVYYGLTADYHYRISFMSTILPPDIKSTKDIVISQGQESDDVYWTCFDLINLQAKSVFYSFCKDLILSVTGKYNEKEALTELKNRYNSWRSLFRNKNKIQSKAIQGLYGELYFLKEYMAKNYSVEEAISSWVGPDGYSKDYSINNEWYEIKTIGVNSNIVNISSIGQLSSTIRGNLVVIKVEKMSEQFDNKQSSVMQLFNDIMLETKDNELKEKLVNKLLNYGFDVENNENNEKYSVASMSIYMVEEDFPRILEKDIKYQEIGNVSYELVVSTLDRFKKE